MGTLLGHILPGTFFIGFAVWWIYSILRRFYTSRYNRQSEAFRSSPTFPVLCLPRVPVEGILKVTAALIGISGEAVTGFEQGHWAHWGNAQHISMFLFFGIGGVVDLLYFYKVEIPEGLDYAAAFIAFLMEGLLFANHLHGRSHMDIMVHTFLLYVIYGCCACVVLEAHFRASAVVALGRAYFTLLQGTWFWQVGFILYPPLGMAHWDEENHEQMMIITMIYSWHYALAGIVTFVLMFIAKRMAMRGARDAGVLDGNRSNVQYQKIGLTRMANGHAESRPITSNGSTLRQAIIESSEDEV